MMGDVDIGLQTPPVNRPSTTDRAEEFPIWGFPRFLLLWLQIVLCWLEIFYLGVCSISTYLSTDSVMLMCVSSVFLHLVDTSNTVIVLNI
jgi:hypothetical protein